MGSFEDHPAVDFPTEQLGFEYETRTTPCYFPFLTDGVIIDQKKSRSGTYVNQQVTPINLGQHVNARELRAFSDKHKIDLPTLFQLTWGIVLASYAGTQSAAFIALKSQKDTCEVKICDLELEDEVTALEALRQLEGKMMKNYLPRDKTLKIPVTEEGGNAFNSIVVFRDSYEASSKTDASGGLVEVCVIFRSF